MLFNNFIFPSPEPRYTKEDMQGSIIWIPSILGHDDVDIKKEDNNSNKENYKGNSNVSKEFEDPNDPKVYRQRLKEFYTMNAERNH